MRKATRTASTANGSNVVREPADAIAEAAIKPVQAPRSCGLGEPDEEGRR